MKGYQQLWNYQSLAIYLRENCVLVSYREIVGFEEY